MITITEAVSLITGLLAVFIRHDSAFLLYLRQEVSR